MKQKKVVLGLFLAILIFVATPLGVLGMTTGRIYNDVPKNQWYYNDVYNAFERQLFTGTAKNMFSPKAAMTRGMLVTVLYRMAGEPAVGEEIPYTDVNPKSYYKNAVIWATETGIVNGFPNQIFAPDMDIPREQMLVILHGYQSKILKQTPANYKELTNFTDSSSVSSWAMEAMTWGVGNGVINGKSPTLLAPLDVSTRAEVAALLMRFRVMFMADTLDNYLTTTISDDQLNALPNNKTSFWFGSDYDGLNRPKEALNNQNTYGKRHNVLTIGSSEEKNIYLTFDEGYENGYTPRILDTLAAKNVKAVFFVTLDYVKNCPDLVQRMINEGHIVGNHSSTHPAAGMPSLGLARERDDIEGLQNLMRNQFGYEMTLFRYPAGIYSPRSLELINSLHMKSVFWSFAYGDYNANSQPGQSSSYNKLVNRLHPGAVYLLHAISSTNTAILGNFIDAAHSQGYRFDLIMNN